jgi:uncharacterized protein with ParB-like and HNH nuclease domain
MTELDRQIEKHKKEIHSDSYPMSIGEAVNMYVEGELDIHPEFQRVYRWTLSQKSKFIESILLGIPIPSFFVAQRDDGVWDLVDGLQRLSTILSFMGELKDENDHQLPSLTLSTGGYLTELEGANWNDESTISKPLKLSFRREKIDFKIIKKESTADTKYDLFRRLNTGGSTLSDQEVRNCLLLMTNKPFYEWLVCLSQEQNFMNTTPLSDDKYSEQYNLELIVRFLVFYSGNWSTITSAEISDIGEFLNDKIVYLAQDDLYNMNETEKIFSKSFELINNALGGDAFRKYYSVDNKHKGGFSIALFEAISIGVARNVEAISRLNAVQLKKKIEEFSTNLEFTSASGSGIRGNTRISRTIPHAIQFFSI